MEEQAIRDLVKEYALAINDTLLDEPWLPTVAHHGKVWGLYSKFYDLSQQERLIVEDECRRLVSSKELPEPVLSFWRKDLTGGENVGYRP